MSERVDLDAVEYKARHHFHAKWVQPTVLALVAELRVAYAFRDEVHSALQPGRWRGFDGPDGVSTHEVIADVAAALERYDQHTTQDPGP
jgi:hypothetical protein